jgi:hypothetical protein
MCTTVKNRAYAFIPILPTCSYHLREDKDERDYRSHGLRQLRGVLEYLPGAV